VATLGDDRTFRRRQVQATMSRTLSMNSGSFDSFHVSTRLGWSPNARQIRETAVC
jgi:hypothetical protein